MRKTAVGKDKDRGKVEAKVVKELNASADAVFEILGDFQRLQPGGPIESVSYEGDGVGMVRTIHMTNGPVVERLDVHDPASRTFSYSIINDDGPLPFANYQARVVVTTLGDDKCSVDWTGTFDPRGVDEDAAINVATGIYAGGIKGARLALGV